MRRICELNLEKYGFQVLEATQGEEALMVEANHPNIGLITSDIRMPKVDGPEFLGRLRQKGWKHPFFFITDGDQTSMDLGQEHQGVINKPFTADSVLNSLTKILKPTC
jgi:chemotaxis family two-component system sensor histidine kinase/response regulator PixL